MKVSTNALHLQRVLPAQLQTIVPAETSLKHVLGIFAVGYLTLQLLRVLYRLSPFHPLAKYPGPTLGKITLFYEGYWDIIKGGTWTRHLNKLHDQYGPVVRYGPNHLHFRSPAAFHTLYSAASKATKDPVLYDSFVIPLSSFGLIDPDAARARREIVLPFFSHSNIIRLQHVLTSRLSVLCTQLDAFTSSNNPFELGAAIRSLTADIILEFCFGETENTLEYPGFKHPLLHAVENSLPLFVVFKHLPLFRKIIRSIPPKLAVTLFPDSRGLHDLEGAIMRQLELFLGDPKKLEETKHPIIYHRLLDTTVKGARGTPSKASLFQEARLMFIAGSDTVGNALSVGAVYILSNKRVHGKLVDELKEKWPNSEEMPRLEEVERWPYLVAVVKECLRIAPGVVAPLTRVAPKEGITIDGHKIQGGTIVAGTIPMLHRNANLFSDPDKFIPERWQLPNSKEMEKNLAPFGKGNRICVGMNLAWAELYLATAVLYRRYEMELYNTSIDDVVDYVERFVPALVKNPIRATIRRRDD